MLENANDHPFRDENCFKITLNLLGGRGMRS